MKKRIAFLCALMLLPCVLNRVAEAQEKPTKFKVEGTVKAVSASALTLIDAENKEWVASINEKKAPRTMSRRQVPVAYLDSGMYVRVFGKVNEQKTAIESDRAEIYEPKPGWGAPKIDKYGATGFLVKDGENLSVESDQVLLRIQWQKKEPRITHQDESVVFSNLGKDDKVNVEIKREGDVLWVDRVTWLKPNLTLADMQGSKPAPATPSIPEVKPDQPTETPAEKTPPKPLPVDLDLRPVNPGHKIGQ